MAATALSRNCYSIYSYSFVLKTVQPRTKRISVGRASSKPQREGGDDDKAAFVSQEDLKYLAKLGGGCVVGSAAIKYGSVIFPEITRPNLGLAFFMIFGPVVVAVLLLIKQSRRVDN